MENKFNVGDRVKWCGVEGVVISDADDPIFPIKVEFGAKWLHLFTVDGRYHPWHTEPSLILVEKAKTKKRVKLYAYINRSIFNPDLNSVGCDVLCEVLYSSKDEAIDCFVRIPEFDREVDVEI